MKPCFNFLIVVFAQVGKTLLYLQKLKEEF